MQIIKELTVSNIIFFDATGGILKNIKKQKPPFFYSMVVHDDVNNKIIPIAEFMTTSHTQTNISKYLLSIKAIFERTVCKSINTTTSKNKYFKCINCDLCLIIFISICYRYVMGINKFSYAKF